MMQNINCNNKLCTYNVNDICTKENIRLNSLGECISKEIICKPGQCTSCKSFRLAQNYGDPVLRQVCLKNNVPNLSSDNNCWE
jgi:hypothetical protein